MEKNVSIQSNLYLDKETLGQNMLKKSTLNSITLAHTLEGFRYKTLMAVLLGSYALSCDVDEYVKFSRLKEYLANKKARDFVLEISHYLTEESIDLCESDFSNFEFDRIFEIRTFLFYRDVFEILSVRDSKKDIIGKILNDDVSMFSTIFDGVADLAFEEYFKHCIEIGVVKEKEVRDYLRP